MAYTYSTDKNDPFINSANDFLSNRALVEPKFKQFDPSTIYRSKQFNECMNYFDLTDDLTRNVLLTVNEADQNVVMTNLSQKLYSHIINKVDDIDFGTIPESKGDITKIQNYDQLMDCITVISEVLARYNQPTTSIEVVQLAVQNVIDRTDKFVMGYKLNIEMPIVIYNTIVLSIVSSVSYLIASCLEYVKQPEDMGFEISLDKTATIKSADALLFKDLTKFNNTCASGEFDKAMDFMLSAKAKNFTGGIMLGFSASAVAIALAAVLLIIPAIRELVFLFYYTRESISTYFELQANLLTMNAYNVQNNLARDAKDRKKIAANQKKVAEAFNKISNKVKVNYKVAEVKAVKDNTTVEKTKYTQDDILDAIPDSSTSVLF
jgi:uncharacterized protein YeeX (DUF496 family)